MCKPLTCGIAEFPSVCAQTGISDGSGELISFIRHLVEPPSVRESDEGVELTENFIKHRPVKNKREEGGERGGGGELEEEETEDEEVGEGESVVFGTRLLHLLAVTFSQMANSAMHSSFVQSSTVDIYWQHTEGGGFVHHAITDSYLRDAKASTQGDSVSPSPRSHPGRFRSTLLCSS